MGTLPRSYRRSGWVVLTNGAMIYLFINGEPGIVNSVLATSLIVGIMLEVSGSIACAPFNVGPYFYVPLYWAWYSIRATLARNYDAEANITLVAFVIPSLTIAAVNLVLYVPPLRQNWRRRKKT